jgi:hypothetical protein
MARLCPCSFCRADVYLPDDLWRRLHPAKVVQRWYITFRGKTQGQLAQEARARVAHDAEARHQVELERAYAQSVDEERQRDVEVAGAMPPAYWMVAAIYVVMIATIGWNLMAAASGHPVPSVSIALQIVSLVLILGGFLVTRLPLVRRTGHGDDMIGFVLIFALAMPVVGQVMALVIAIKRFGGRFGGPSALKGGVAYPSVQLRGESVPIGLVYLALALLWPASLGSAIYALTAASSPTAHAAPTSPAPHGARGRGR